MNGQVEMVWGDGDHVFNIAKIGQLLELEDKCAAGIMEIFDRIRNNKWKVNDLRETIRLALIGGGKTPVEAITLIKRYFDDRPLQENVIMAQIILMAAIVGVPGDEVGKENAEETKTEETNASSPLPSTDQAQPLDGHPDKFASAPSGSYQQPSTALTEPMEPKTNLIL